VGSPFCETLHKLGYPFAESIRSILPIVDEFIIALGPSDDQTEAILRQIGDRKIRILNTQWNDRIRNDLGLKGFVYGQQKSIALFNCTGDGLSIWRAMNWCMRTTSPKSRSRCAGTWTILRLKPCTSTTPIFGATINTYVDCPSAYRKAPRIVRNNITVWAPKGLFFIVMDSKRRGRYPKAASANARIFHYGNMRTDEQVRLKTLSIL